MIPRVSVLCSVLNGARHLPAAIASIRGQSYEDFEFILINDGSTDETPEVLRRAASHDSRIVVLHQDNLGLTRSLNVGLSRARGEFVARQDADDVSLPDRLAAQVDFLDRNPEYLVVGSRYLKIDERGRMIGKCLTPLGDFAIRYQLLSENAIAHSSATFRRQPVLELGGYDEALPVAQDYDLWCRVAMKGRLANLRTLLIQRREHSDRIGASVLPEQQRLRDQIAGRYREVVSASTPSGFGDRVLRLAARMRLRGKRARPVA